MSVLDNLSVKIFADGAHLDDIVSLHRQPFIKGFTTNPTLMRKAGVADYEAFGRAVLSAVPDRPVSLEVFADDFATMIAQAKAIARWGANVNIKIPVTTTDGTYTGPVIRALSRNRVTINVTAVMTPDQIRRIAEDLAPDAPAIVSVFAGRIADSGIDPVPLMLQAREILATRPRAELLWASPREILNLIQADEAGCHIITMTPDLLAKIPSLGKSLDAFSLETVRMFHRDAATAGYTIDIDDAGASVHRETPECTIP